MTSFYIAPLKITTYPNGVYRTAPLFFDADLNPEGVLNKKENGDYSLMDFGAKKNWGLLTTEQPIPSFLMDSSWYAFPDDLFKAPAVNEKDAIFGFLQDIGIEEGLWVKEGESHREILHRLAGMCQSLQSADDDPLTVPEKQDPSRWLINPIKLGFTELVPYDARGFEMAAFVQEQTILAELTREYPYPARFQNGWLWMDLPKGHRFNPKGGWTPIGSGGGILGTDNFTATSDQALTTYSSNWVYNSGTFQVLGASDDVHCSNSGESGAFRNDITMPNDQYAQLKITVVGFTSFIGPAVRCGASGVASYYGFYDRDNHDYSFKMVTGNWTEFGSTGSGCSANDVDYLSAVGTTITSKRNNIQIRSNTDSSLSSGKAGISGYANHNGTRGDDWEAGDFAAEGHPAMRRFGLTNYIRPLEIGREGTKVI